MLEKPTLENYDHNMRLLKDMADIRLDIYNKLKGYLEEGTYSAHTIKEVYTRLDREEEEGGLGSLQSILIHMRKSRLYLISSNLLNEGLPEAKIYGSQYHRKEKDKVNNILRSVIGSTAAPTPLTSLEVRAPLPESLSAPGGAYIDNGKGKGVSESYYESEDNNFLPAEEIRNTNDYLEDEYDRDAFGSDVPREGGPSGIDRRNLAGDRLIESSAPAESLRIVASEELVVEEPSLRVENEAYTDVGPL